MDRTRIIVGADGDVAYPRAIPPCPAPSDSPLLMVDAADWLGLETAMPARLLTIFTAVAISIFACGCAHLNPFAHSSASSPTPTPAPSTAKLQGKYETFTGKVVLAAEGYRLRLSDSNDDLRITRAKQRTELASEEINLRKYYEKTLAVHGRRENEWIWDAEIVGQWTRPGESTGPNLLAPPTHR